jgi:hypothetical protein
MEIRETSRPLSPLAYLAAGVDRRKEYREQLNQLGKGPVLFVMAGAQRCGMDVTFCDGCGCH